MSKGSYVKAAAQGGNDTSGGGGPPGTWTQLASGFIPVNAGAEMTIATVQTPDPGSVVLAFVCDDGQSGTRVFQGNTGAVPPAGSCVYCLRSSGTSTALNVRIAAGTINLSYVVYMVTPAP